MSTGPRNTILFIGKRYYTSRDAWLDRYGRIYQLPWYWSRSGWDVRLWLVDYRGRRPEQGTDGPLRIVSTPLRSPSFPWMAAKAIAAGRPAASVVVASGDCYVGLLGWCVARRMRARFVFDVYDKYDEFAGYRSLPGFDPFRFLLRRADVRLFASRAVMGELSGPGANVLVPNGVDTGRFAPRDMHESRVRTGLPPDRLLVGYFGGMEPDRGVADLVSAVQLLRARGMDIELVLGGANTGRFPVEQEGVRYVGNVPFAGMPDMLASCDLLAVPYRRSTFMDAGASNKIAEAIASGRPLVATRTPNFMENFAVQAGMLGDRLARPSDAEDLARVIELQARDRRLVPMPAGMDWEGIAMRTLEAIK